MNSRKMFRTNPLRAGLILQSTFQGTVHKYRYKKKDYQKAIVLFIPTKVLLIRPFLMLFANVDQKPECEIQGEQHRK